MIIIIDYKVGNLGSFKNLFKKIGVEAKISADPKEIIQAEKLILPGVGAFDNGIEHLNQSGLKALLNEEVIVKGKPLLGVCLGMQLLTEGSEEGVLPGLGWIKGVTKKFDLPAQYQDLKIPHMGWNKVKFRENSLFADLYEQDPRFYFVHSYHVCCDSQEHVLGTTEYGLPFVSAIQKNNIMGVQFHPEKSHQFGMKLLKQFSLAEK